MVFSSVTFLFYFLPLFLLAYHTLPWPNAVLLVASLIFYAWGDPTRLPLLLFCILLNYGFGLWIGRRPNPSDRAHRWLLALGVAANLALLLVFKYAAFAASQIDALLGSEVLTVPNIALPLGISFFTFQGISYLVDIHRGDISPQRSLSNYATYKAMFPPLIAGPIVRYAQVADQVARRSTTAADFTQGIETFAIGLGQKVLIANTLAGPVDAIFARPGASLDAATAWLGAIGYGVQIYFDFNGYTNMAIGLGRMMGFTLPPNFNRPYAAQSVTDFWRRWHISLSTWFRDYLYIPLGGNRVSPVRTYCNLTLVFLLCGLWHGASWNFAIWGLWHGAFLAIERAGLRRLLQRLPALLRHAYLLLVVVIGWVPFRGDGLAATGAYLAAMLRGDAAIAPGTLPASAACALLAGAVLSVWPRETLRFAPLRQAACLGLLVLSACSLAAGTYNPFIYFRF